MAATKKGLTEESNEANPAGDRRDGRKETSQRHGEEGRGSLGRQAFQHQTASQRIQCSR